MWWFELQRDGEIGLLCKCRCAEHYGPCNATEKTGGHMSLLLMGKALVFPALSRRIDL
jgi:hypothetical protein